MHRIGRTGRAGREGDAILFAANRERRLLRAIEKATGSIEKMELPSAEEVTDKRIGKFKGRITETLDAAELDVFRKLVEDYQAEYGVPVIEIAAALGAMAQGNKPLVAKARAEKPKKDKASRDKDQAGGKKAREKSGDIAPPDKGMERFRIEVGHEHGVKPGNIVGAIANEAEIDAEYIGRIEIYGDHSTVDLPEGMPKEVFQHLKSVWVSGQKLKISRPGAPAKGKGKRKPAPRKANKGKGGAKRKS